MVYRGHVANDIIQLNPTTIHYLKWNPIEKVEEEDVFNIEDTDRTVHLIQWFVRGLADA